MKKNIEDKEKEIKKVSNKPKKEKVIKKTEVNVDNLEIKEVEKPKKESIWVKAKRLFNKGDYRLNETFTYHEMIVVMCVSLFVGIIGAVSVTIALSGGRNYIKLNTDLKKFVEVYENIINKYYSDVDKKKLVDGAINGMLATVDDPYTTYYDSENAESFLEKVEGTYSGIGCEIVLNENNQVVVYRIFDNSPAAKAGLQKDDIFLEIDGKSYEGKSTAEISEYIKSSKEKTVKLKIKRGEEEKELKLTREKIEIPSVSTEIYEVNNKKIGYMYISIFSSVTTNQVETKLKELEKTGIDSLIIDVRDDSGGYLSVAGDVSSLFLEKGKVIYQLESGKTKTKKKDTNSKSRSYDIVVLTNTNSASASEILASALKESYGATIVGTRTYGKATVQKAKELSDGSLVKYTIQKWYTPNGNWLDGVGLAPDHEVNLDENYYENPIPENDNQLQKALEILSK